MNCTDVKYDLLNLLEGDLETSQEVQIREHLSACETCTANYNELQQTLAIIETERTAVLDDDFSASVLEAIKEQNQTVSFTSRMKQVLLYAAVVSIGIFIGSLTANLLVASNDQVSHDPLQELYLDGLKAEPLETFLISN